MRGGFTVTLKGGIRGSQLNTQFTKAFSSSVMLGSTAEAMRNASQGQGGKFYYIFKNSNAKTPGQKYKNCLLASPQVARSSRWPDHDDSPKTTTTRKKLPLPSNRNPFHFRSSLNLLKSFSFFFTSLENSRCLADYNYVSFNLKMSKIKILNTPLLKTRQYYSCLLYTSDAADE